MLRVRAKAVGVVSGVQQVQKVAMPRQEWVAGKEGWGKTGVWGREERGAGETRPRTVRVESPGACAERAAAGGSRTRCGPGASSSPLQLKPAGLW